MVNWPKIQPIYERKAYRIVQKHISKILENLPYQNVTLSTYEATIALNITKEQIFSMYKELYSTIGLDYGNRVNKDLEKVKKANVLFNEQLLKEILLFLSNEGGLRVTSVRDTLIQDVIKSIQESLGVNGTIVDLRNAIQAIIEKNQTFYKWQSLRIARTETTTASNYAAMRTAEMSDLVLQKQWISVSDNRTRFDHMIENNQVVDLEDNFVMQSGAVLQYPGDNKAPAHEVINCRCTVAFIPKRDVNGELIIKAN